MVALSDGDVGGNSGGGGGHTGGAVCGPDSGAC